MTAMLVLLAALPVLAPGAQATTFLSEDFENASFPGWTVSGSTASQDCTRGAPGCSLLLSPVCCSTNVQLSQNPNLGMGSQTFVSFMFQAASTGGDTDTNVIVGLSNGGQLVLHMSAGFNNGVLFQSAGGGSEQFGSWSSANTWYMGLFAINPSANTAYGQLRDSSGNVLATSSTFSIPASADTINEIRFEAVFWGGGFLTFNYDTLRVTDTAPAVPAFPPSAPQALAANPGPGLGQISLTWQAPSSNGNSAITNYKVYRSETAGGPYGPPVVLGNALSYTDSGREVGKNFFYVVSAVNAVGEGVSSNEASAPGTGLPGSIPIGIPPISQQFVVPSQTVTTPAVVLPATCTLSICTGPTIIPSQTVTTPPIAPQTVTVEGVDPQTVTTPSVTVPQTCVPLVICVGPVTIPAQSFGPTPGVPDQTVTTPGADSQTVTVPGQTVPAICTFLPAACFGPTTVLGPVPVTTSAVTLSVTTTAITGSVDSNAGESTPVGPISQEITVGGITIPVTLCPNTCPVPAAPGASLSGTLAIAVTVGNNSQGVTVPINV